MYKKIGLVLTLLGGTLIALSSTSHATPIAGPGYHIANQFSDSEQCFSHSGITPPLAGFEGNSYLISTGAYHFGWIRGMCSGGGWTNPVGVIKGDEETELANAPQGKCPSGSYPDEVDGFYTAYGLGAMEYTCFNPKTGTSQGQFHFGNDTQGSYSAGRCGGNDVMIGFKAWLAATLSNPPGNLETTAITELDLICGTSP